jgi:hypothetical protein
MRFSAADFLFSSWNASSVLLSRYSTTVIGFSATHTKIMEKKNEEEKKIKLD